MIDRIALLADARQVTNRLVDDLRVRTDRDEQSQVEVRGTYGQAVAAGRTDKSYEEWREDLLAQVAPGWVLATVFVRFCEDNGLVATPLLSGPGERLDLARDHRADFFAHTPTAGDREWLEEVFARYQRLPAVAAIFGERNPLWQLAPSADGARALLELWWRRDDDGRNIRHDFTDPQLDTRFLGDLYQDLSEHARKQFALLQTPEFVEEFILDRTLDPAVATFGLDGLRMIDPTCGSGHFLLGAFSRLLALWQEREPAGGARDLVQRALDSVHGVDVNPFAVEIARFRLLVAALKASGLSRLEDLPAFRLNLAVGDSLLHGTRPGRLSFGPAEYAKVLAHRYPHEDGEQAHRILQADSYHAVVGNPPYITVKDGAVREVIRSLYASAAGKYALTVPFVERFHELAVPGNGEQHAGFVGQITSNSFMKREFGKSLITHYLRTKDLTHVIDTSGAYIPGHGTPTVILFSRNRKPGGTVRAVLSIRGEPGRPENPARGLVWSAIMRLTDRPGAEDDYISVDDLDRERLSGHPWSLQGGAAPFVFTCVDSAANSRLGESCETGVTAVTGEDDVYLNIPMRAVEGHPRRPFVSGELVRDWTVERGKQALYPYTEEAGDADLGEQAWRHYWPYRRLLATNIYFGKTRSQRGLRLVDYAFIARNKLRTPLTIVFAFVATHNHFVLDRGGKVFNRTAPVIKLEEGVGQDEHLELLGLLNSSTACFWIKQVSHNKGDSTDSEGARVSGVDAWVDSYEHDATKLKQFPLPAGRPSGWARAIDGAAQRLAEVLPSAVAASGAPTRAVLDTARVEVEALRLRMVALQEELDWACYRLYGLVDDDLTIDLERLPSVARGERAFEIALARRMASGEVSSTWFERHGSTPVTEVLAQWPADYRALVTRRLELIDADRGLRLLERPEYKRRWNWAELADLEREAQRTWLLGRIEALASAEADEPAVATCARLADRLAADADAVAVADDLAAAGTDLVALVTELVTSAGVPYLAAWRYTDTGLRTRAVWERTWDQQRTEDALEARTKLPREHPQHLTEAELAVARKEAGVDRIPVPPKYKQADFRSATSWRLRGKLDVPKERFVLYPATRVGADASPVVAWAGWDHLQQARALAAHYGARKDDGADSAELVPLLAGIAELLPWVLQWHDEPDPMYGERMGQFFSGFVTAEAASLGMTGADLAAWRPPAAARGRRARTAS